MIQDLWTGLLDLSKTFITPDWGVLVTMIPMGLAALVLLYLAWTALRFATAGPTSRGVRRRPPVAASGFHIQRPSLAPVLAAFGIFIALVGWFSSPIWIAVGVVGLLAALLAWRREAVRGR